MQRHRDLRPVLLPLRERPHEPRTASGALRPQEARQRRWLSALALVVVAGGAVASIASATAWGAYVRSQSAQSFAATAAGAANVLGMSLQRDAELVAAARAFVQTTPQVSDARFTSWFELLDGRSADPGSFGLLYVERVTRRDLASFERLVGADPPFGHSALGAGAVRPAGARPAYCLTRAGVVKSAPAAPVPPSLLSALLDLTRPDIDYCSLPLGSLLRQSARRGTTAGFTLASLLSASPTLPGFPASPAGLAASAAAASLVGTVTPVYATSGRTSAPPGRAAAIEGWMLAIYQSGSILAPAVAGRQLSAVLTFTNPDGSRVVLARNGPPRPGAAALTYRLPAPGRFSVTLAARASASGISAVAQEAAVLLGGLLLTALMALLVLVLSRSRSRALQLVEQRTAQLLHQALHDELTGLPNRALIYDRAEQLLGRAQRDGTRVAALFVDLDQFKDVNDTLGHGAGDELLRQVGRRLQGVVRHTDTVGRLGGDEFVVLADVRPGSPEATELARRVIVALEEPVQVRHGRTAAVAASVGIAETMLGSAEALLSDADIALYEAKATAKGGYVVFHPEMRAVFTARIDLESELRAAIAEHQFFLAYQPTFDLGDRHVTGAEALLRWRHPVRGVLSPSEFVVTLEDTGLIVEVGRFVLREACSQASRWRAAGHDIGVSVNVSGRQLDEEDFTAVVRAALAHAGLEPEALTLELTETALMRDSTRSAARLAELKQVGVRLAIDDFGTGYCSLAYLQQFPVDLLKIDRSFVSRLDGSSEGKALVHTILRLGRDLNLATLAEGIETSAQLAELRLERCSAGQGFLLAEPLDADALDELLSASPSRQRRLERA